MTWSDVTTRLGPRPCNLLLAAKSIAVRTIAPSSAKTFASALSRHQRHHAPHRLAAGQTYNLPDPPAEEGRKAVTTCAHPADTRRTAHEPRNAIFTRASTEAGRHSPSSDPVPTPASTKLQIPNGATARISSGRRYPACPCLHNAPVDLSFATVRFACFATTPEGCDHPARSAHRHL